MSCYFIISVFLGARVKDRADYDDYIKLGSGLLEEQEEGMVRSEGIEYIGKTGIRTASLMIWFPDREK